MKILCSLKTGLDQLVVTAGDPPPLRICRYVQAGETDQVNTFVKRICIEML